VLLCESGKPSPCMDEREVPFEARGGGWWRSNCQSDSVLDRCMSGGERSCKRSSSSSVND
jgi:hypothetical protein